MLICNDLLAQAALGNRPKSSGNTVRTFDRPKELVTIKAAIASTQRVALRRIGFKFLHAHYACPPWNFELHEFPSDYPARFQTVKIFTSYL
jgi:hypothetical protein